MKNDKRKKTKLDKRIYLLVLIAFVIGAITSITSSYAIAETLIKSVDVSYVDNSNLKATNVQAAIDGTCTKFSNDLQSFLLKVYPVGSIYISYNNTNPGTLFGGTWEIIGDGRVLKGISSGTAGTTGGSSTVTLSMSNIPAHTHTYDKANANTDSHTLTIAEIPRHNHSINSSGQNSNGEYGYQIVWDGKSAFVGGTTRIGYEGGGQGHTHPISTTSTNTGSAGSSNPTAISVQDPYVTVYMWKRKS